VLLWLGREETTYVIRYEDLLAEDPRVPVRRALDALGVRLPTMPGATIPAFSELQARWPEFFRAGRVGAWRGEMASDLEELFWVRHGQAMLAMGYARSGG
jgi:hypothetical protein